MTDKKHYASTGEVADPWGPPKATPPNVSEQTLERWRSIVSKVCEICKSESWSRAEAARRIDMPAGTFTPVIDGTYTGNYGNQLVKLERWLESREEVRQRVVTLPDEPGYFETPTSREVLDVLLYAQAMPQMAVVTLASGLGKTTSARQFRNRPGVYLATMRPTTSGTHRMLQEIAVALDVNERSANKLDRAIGQKLKRNGRQTLLIVDEAQNLNDEAVDQLRFFFDEYRCGIALLGNEAVFARFGRGDTREGFGQIHRRIGFRLRRMTPLPADIEKTIEAWGVEDDEIRKLLRAIGRKPGTLGQISETMKLARMLAAGEGAALEAKHVRDAWTNRAGEEMR